MKKIAILAFAATAIVPALMGVIPLPGTSAAAKDNPRTIFCDRQLKACIAPCKRMHGKERLSCYRVCEDQVLECMRHP